MAVPVKVDKETTKNILFLVAGLVVIIIVIVVFFSVRRNIRKKKEERITTNNVIDEVVENQQQTQVIVEATGLNKSDIDRARNIANFIADKMGTHIDTPIYEPALFGTPKNVVINQLNRIESEDEAILVASFYEDQMTESRSLRADLDSLFGNSGLSKIEFNYAIK